MPREVTPVAVTLGQQEPNAVYRKPEPPTKPWSDRHPGVLYGVLLAAILVMGFLAVKFLLKVERT
jgi:hypothetical protein